MFGTGHCVLFGTDVVCSLVTDVVCSLVWTLRVVWYEHCVFFGNGRCVLFGTDVVCCFVTDVVCSLVTDVVYFIRAIQALLMRMCNTLSQRIRHY